MSRHIFLFRLRNILISHEAVHSHILQQNCAYARRHNQLEVSKKIWRSRIKSFQCHLSKSQVLFSQVIIPNDVWMRCASGQLNKWILTVTKIAVLRCFNNWMKKFSFVSCIHFRARSSSGEGGEGRNPRRTRNTSRSTAISGKSAGSTPRGDQERSEIQSLHLIVEQRLSRFPGGATSRARLTNFSGAFWTHGQTNVAWISRIGEVAWHWGLCEFHSYALCREASHRELFAKSHLCRLHLI